MHGLRLAGLLAMAALAAPFGAAAARRAPVRFEPSSLPFVLESRLSPGGIVACLSKRAVQPTVLMMDRGERVLLGPGNGWIDLLPAANGSWLKVRILWESPGLTERWVRGCAVGEAPHRGMPPSTRPVRWPGPVMHPG